MRTLPALFVLCILAVSCESSPGVLSAATDTQLPTTSTLISTQTTVPPTPTQTSVPPTPSVEPPSSLSEWLDGARVVMVDHFDDASNWNKWDSGVGDVSDGAFVLPGRTGWSGIALRRRLSVGSAVLLKYKTSAPFDAKAQLDFDNGEWPTNSYWSFALYTGSKPKGRPVHGDASFGAKWLTGNLTTKPDSWYECLIALGAPGEFLAVVWNPDDPMQRDQYHEKVSGAWPTDNWEFIVKANQGETISIDDLMLLSFNTIK